MTRKKQIKKKVEIVFDADKRKDFLTGFRKRKNERRKRAQEELERNLKEERKRIRQEIKDGIKHMKKTYEPLRELTEQDKANEDEYEDDDVKVKIVELSTNDLAAQRNMLGENRTADSSDDEGSVAEEENDSDTAHNTNCIPGMDFDVNARQKKKRNAAAATNYDDDEAMPVGKKVKMSGPIELKSKKDLDRIKKQKTLKKLKQSKVFKQKERIDKKVNQKKAKRDRNNTLKSLPKNQRKKLKQKPTQSRYHKGRMLNRKQLRQKRQQS